MSQLTYALIITFDDCLLSLDEFERYMNELGDRLNNSLNLYEFEWYYVSVKDERMTSICFQFKVLNRSLKLTHEKIDRTLLAAHKDAMEELGFSREKLVLRLVD